jgi:signal transduction histidine kinase
VRFVRSLRFRVTALATALVLVVLAAGGVALVAFQHRMLLDDLDDALDEEADRLEQAVGGGASVITLEPVGDDVVAQLVATDGRVIAASPGLRGLPSILEPDGLVPGGPRTVDTLRDGDAEETDDLSDGDADDDGAADTEADTDADDEPDVDDDRHRVVVRRVQTGGQEARLVVAASLDDVDESGQVLATSLLVGVPVVGVVLAIGVWWLVGRTLRPVERIRAEVDQIGDGRLDRRVPRPPGDDEIARLAGTMNAMLDRLEAASRRQQRFVADASHELRTPLTRMRAELEVDLTHPDTADVAATNRSVLDEIATMQRLVDDLLVLARTDAGVAARAHETVQLDELVTAEASRVAGSGGPVVDTSAVSPAAVVGDRDQLRRAVGNLVDNAARHAATRVGVAVTQRDGRVVVDVTDDGPGIPAAERDRVFERFVRLDEARTAGAGGTGLGLAIARDIVARHHGTVVAADPGPDGGARLVVELPAAER